MFPEPAPPADPPSNGADTNTPALETRELTKVYDGVNAVSNVSLSVPKGSLYGLVGANGAGKTTWLSMATGLLRPTHGSAFVDGANVWADPVGARGRIGLLPDGPTMSEALPGRIALRYVGVLQGLAPAVADARADDLLAVFDIADSADKPVNSYSAGMKKKIGLAAALIHSPALLVLDEPLEAVDPVSAVTIREILTRFTASGGTVILSSHSMSLIEQICTHVAILNRGTLVVAGDTAQVRAGTSLESILVDTVGRTGSTAGIGLDWLGTATHGPDTDGPATPQDHTP